MTDGTMITLMPETAAMLQGSTEQLGAYLVQMSQIMMRIQNRLDELEEKQQAATLRHDEVQTIQRLIRNRALEYCEKYDIICSQALTAIRAGIKKAVLQRYGVKDLHDVPAIARQAVEAQIERWSDVRLMMKCRDKLRAGGA